MSSLQGCEIHVDQQLSSHLFIGRWYKLDVYLKRDGVPKWLDTETELKLITSVKSQCVSTDCFEFEVDNPSYFKQSGDTSTRFKVTAVRKSTSMPLFIECLIPNSLAVPWTSSPFVAVSYKLGMTKPLKLIDGDKWYKDEGGKHNFLCFEIGLVANNADFDEFVSIDRDVAIRAELLYFDDKTKVLNQSMVLIVKEMWMIQQ